MIWNCIVHIVIGLLGTEFFDWTAEGLLVSLVVVCITQPSESLRQYTKEKNKISQSPPNKRKSQLEAFDKKFKKELAPILIQNIIMYMAIVLLSAEIARASGFVI